MLWRWGVALWIGLWITLWILLRRILVMLWGWWGRRVPLICMILLLVLLVLLGRRILLIWALVSSHVLRGVLWADFHRVLLVLLGGLGGW